jgi:hypothetical protein
MAVEGHCIFCDEFGPLSAEDPIAHWLDKLLQHFTTGPRIRHTRKVVEAGEVLDERSGTRQTLSVYKVPVVCQRTCNGGWMSELEQEAIPILSPMVLGHRRGLSMDDQSVIARWMMLKALFFDLVEETDQTADRSDFHDFYAARVPPPRFECWLARYKPDREDILFHVRNSFSTKIEHNGVPALTPHAQHLTLVLGHLVVQSIFVNNRTQGYPEVFTRTEPEPHIARIWPSSRVVDWPPPLTLTSKEIEMFATGTNDDGSPA